MRLTKSMLVGAVFLLGTAFAGTAQSQYLQYPYSYPYPAPYVQVPAPPPSWSYDPYTSGFGPCPQRLPTDSTSCAEQMPPTFGQPGYRPFR